MLTGFFGSTGCNGFFDTVFTVGFRDIGANGATLAVLRSTLRTIGEVIEVRARTSKSLFVLGFDLNVSSKLAFDKWLLSFFDEDFGAKSVDRITIFVRSFFVAVCNGFIWDLKKPVIFVCAPIVWGL